MTLKNLIELIPYDERIEIDKRVSTNECVYFKTVYFGRKMHFEENNFLNAKVQMISTLPDEAGRTLYIVIE